MKISVIMGVYNDEVYLPSAIESILNQSYTDFEFIICNDCSTDSSMDIILRYASIDQRIVPLENEKNLGLAATLNKCIAYSKGVYIARMDSDDISLEERFLHQIEFVDNHKDCDVVGTFAYFIDQNNNKYAKFERPLTVTLSQAVKNSLVIHPTALIKKTTLTKVGGYSDNENTRRAEDYDLWCKILQQEGKIYNIDTFDFLYRVDQANIKKRKYKYRIQEAKIKYYWMKKTNQNIKSFVYVLKPLLVGLLPKKIYESIIRRR